MKRFRITAAKKYQKQDGSQGTKWINLGAVTQKEDGSFFGELECLPTGAWFDGTINLYPIEQQGQVTQNNTSARTQNNQQKTNNYNTNHGNYGQNNYGNYQG
ncbi:hypothetical protein [Aliarcobacter butzleri]|uniref:hypothetical protein n=1 Tax=Aliarcobacter butzleri TaxID=28197 RepID=UPI00125FC907|nr:hypothetical protein [Aliarcobacter butzleri]